METSSERPYACRALKQFRQISAVTADGEIDESTPNATNHAAGRLSFAGLVRGIAFDCLARADALGPDE